MGAREPLVTAERILTAPEEILGAPERPLKTPEGDSSGARGFFGHFEDFLKGLKPMPAPFPKPVYWDLST